MHESLYKSSNIIKFRLDDVQPCEQNGRGWIKSYMQNFSPNFVSCMVCSLLSINRQGLLMK